jgi:putative FmdB family regulatory protein
MPMYEYECGACGHRFEQIQKFSDPPVKVCPSCGKRKVQKLVSSPAIQFKGSGFYINDYAKKGTKDADGKTKAPSTDTKAASTDSTATASASDSKAATTTPAAAPAKDSAKK